MSTKLEVWETRGHRQWCRYVILLIDGTCYLMTGSEWQREKHIMVTVNAGHTVGMVIQYLDQNGNPMVTTPVPDQPPTWTNSNGQDTLTVAPDGNSATLAIPATMTGGGSDTVTLGLNVAGKAFSATLAVTITATPQVLTSIAIVPTVS